MQGQVKKTPSRICVLASGGVESGAMIYLLAQKHREVFPLYVSHGFVWEKAEIYWLKRFIRKLGSASVQKVTVLHYPLRPLYGSHWSLTGKGIPSAHSADEEVFLPGRNILLLSLASIFCYARNIPAVAVGTLATNPFPDGSGEFFRLASKTFSRGYGKSLKIERPFVKLKKKEVLRIALGAPLDLTFSCLQPKGKNHCGKCNKCAERAQAGIP